MLAILNSLYAHNLPIFQPILMILVSKFMFYKALSYKTYLALGLMSPLRVDKSLCLPKLKSITVLLYDFSFKNEKITTFTFVVKGMINLQS